MVINNNFIATFCKDKQIFPNRQILSLKFHFLLILQQLLHIIFPLIGSFKHFFAGFVPKLLETDGLRTVVQYDIVGVRYARILLFQQRVKEDFLVLISYEGIAFGKCCTWDWPVWP